MLDVLKNQRVVNNVQMKKWALPFAGFWFLGTTLFAFWCGKEKADEIRSGFENGGTVYDVLLGIPMRDHYRIEFVHRSDSALYGYEEKPPKMSDRMFAAMASAGINDQWSLWVSPQRIDLVSRSSRVYSFVGRTVLNCPGKNWVYPEFFVEGRTIKAFYRHPQDVINEIRAAVVLTTAAIALAVGFCLLLLFQCGVKSYYNEEWKKQGWTQAPGLFEIEAIKAKGHVEWSLVSTLFGNVTCLWRRR